jgi:hypothetical protein
MAVDLATKGIAMEEGEEQQQQTSGESSLTKLSMEHDADEKPNLDIVDGETMESSGIRVENAVITGWRLNLVIVW